MNRDLNGGITNSGKLKRAGGVSLRIIRRKAEGGGRRAEGGRQTKRIWHGVRSKMAPSSVHHNWYVSPSLAETGEGTARVSSGPRSTALDWRCRHAREHEVAGNRFAHNTPPVLPTVGG